MTWNW